MLFVPMAYDFCKVSPISECQRKKIDTKILLSNGNGEMAEVSTFMFRLNDIARNEHYKSDRQKNIDQENLNLYETYNFKCLFCGQIASTHIIILNFFRLKSLEMDISFRSNWLK